MLGTLAITGGGLYIGLKLYNLASSRSVFEKIGIAGWWQERRFKINMAPADASQEAEVKTVTTGAKQSPQTIQEGLLLSSLSLALATAGGLFYAPLSMVTIPALLYLGVSSAKEALRSLWDEGEASIAFLDTVILAVCLVQGYYIASSLLFWFDYISQKGLHKPHETDNYRPKGAFSHVVEKAPPFAWVQKEGILLEVPTNELKADEIVVVEAGEMVPADGIISEGYALIDQHLLTGDSQPISQKIGDNVFAGVIVLVGRIGVKIERVGHATRVAQIAPTLKRSIIEKQRWQIRSEKASQQLALPMLCVGSMASFVLGPMGAIAIMGSRWGYDRVAPLGMAKFLEQALEGGILIRDGRALERLSQVKIVVIDHQVAVDAFELIRSLRTHHIKSIYLFSSDHQLKKEAAMWGLDGCFSETSPEDKARVIEQLQAEGESICYIAHEIIELIQKKSNVSISVGGISQITSDSADIILLDGTLNQLGTLFDLAKRFEVNSKTAFMTTLVPAMLAISAPFLFHSGLITTIVLNQIGLWIGAARWDRFSTERLPSICNLYLTNETKELE